MIDISLLLFGFMLGIAAGAFLERRRQGLNERSVWKERLGGKNAIVLILSIVTGSMIADQVIRWIHR